jgi:SAM-dependent methyltransferase
VLNVDYDAAPAVADFYDSTLVYLERKDVDFYVEAARAARGPVLELGCGTGRILLPTARAGVEITGLDSSANMLARCREKLAAEPAPLQRDLQRRVTLVSGSLADFDLGRTFNLITMPFRPFQHLLTVEQQLSCLAAVKRHLAPGGRLIFDVFQVQPAAVYDPSWMVEKEDGPITRLADGRIVRRTVRVAAFHRAQQINDVEFCWYITHPDGRREQVHWRVALRYFYRFELEHLLVRAGLRVAALYGNFERAPFGEDSQEMIFVAEKDSQ